MRTFVKIPVWMNKQNKENPEPDKMVSVFLHPDSITMLYEFDGDAFICASGKMFKCALPMDSIAEAIDQKKTTQLEVIDLLKKHMEE